MQKVGVIGIGKLGLCFALNLEAKGFEVWGIDVSPEYVNSLKEKTFTSPEPGLDALLQSSRNFHPSTHLHHLVEKDVRIIFVCVPTPSLHDGSFDHSMIEAVGTSLMALGKPDVLVDLVVVATTMPGFCDAFAKRISGSNYRVSYNPEFIAQGSILHDQLFPDQILIGEEAEEAGDRIVQVYQALCENSPVYCRMDRLSAEITKLATNCFLTTKITFANTLGDLALKAGANPEKILRAIGSDSRIGHKYLQYGFGYGGPCFPRDNKALLKFASETGLAFPISEATDRGNALHLEFQLNEYLKNYPADEPILMESITYKKGTVILEASQQFALALRLVSAGRKVRVKAQPEVIQQVESDYPGLFEWLPES